jgi:hypothetical protein
MIHTQTLISAKLNHFISALPCRMNPTTGAHPVHTSKHHRIVRHLMHLLQTLLSHKRLGLLPVVRRGTGVLQRSPRSIRVCNPVDPRPPCTPQQTVTTQVIHLIREFLLL